MQCHLKTKGKQTTLRKEQGMSELGDYIRRIEWEINSQVNGTKQLALNSIKGELELEEGGNV